MAYALPQMPASAVLCHQLTLSFARIPAHAVNRNDPMTRNQQSKGLFRHAPPTARAELAIFLPKPNTLAFRQKVFGKSSAQTLF